MRHLAWWRLLQNAHCCRRLPGRTHAVKTALALHLIFSVFAESAAAEVTIRRRCGEDAEGEND